MTQRGRLVKKLNFTIFCFAMAAASFLHAVPASPRDASRYFEAFFSDPASIPVEFTYDGVRHEGLGGLKVLDRQVGPAAPVRRGRLTCALDDTLAVTLEAAFCTEFDEVEYTLWFANTGAKPSKTLADVYAYRARVPGGSPRLRGILGDHVNRYAAYDSDLIAEPRSFHSTNGRATHVVFPYFNFVHGGGGTLMALGWAGTWEAAFLGMSDGTYVMAKTCIGLNAALLTGERVRTGLVVLLPYEGRDPDRATNLWRAWFMKYNLPKANAKGDPIKPFSTALFAFDTGLPNSDGSISECATTWKRTLDKLVAENVVPDFRWFDAGWYFDPANRTVPTDWWGTVGTWELDRGKWPGKTFRESNEACHKLGMKVFVWFEPERVTHLDDLCGNYGYKQEWGVPTGRSITSNIGDDGCLAWTLGRITKMMEEHAVDMYREDNNSNPAAAWNILDARDAERTGLPRAGINENKMIQGHYKLWDGIIDYCAKHGKCTFVDSCASGGGRNDIESMRRGVPVMRSDYDRTTIPLRLSMTWSLCKWIPFHGTFTKEASRGNNFNANGPGSDVYVSRASYLPIYNNISAFTQNKELDYDLMRRNITEWKSVRHLLTRDFYALTPWHGPKFDDGWTVFAYDAPDIGESIVLAFRMAKAKESDFIVKLPFPRLDSSYTLTDADSGRVQTLTGWKLRKGLKVMLPTARSSALIRIKRTGKAKPPHEAALAVRNHIEEGRAVCADEAGGTWSFLCRSEIASNGGLPMIPKEDRVEGRPQGFKSPSYVAEPAIVLVNLTDGWMLEPSVAGGRKDRPLKPFEFLVHPAPPGEANRRSVIRYTSDKDAAFRLCADFRALNVGKGSVDISVVLSGKVLWQKELVRDGKTYVDLPPLSLPGIGMKAGQHLDVVVGPGLATDAPYQCDGTGVTLTVIDE